MTREVVKNLNQTGYRKKKYTACTTTLITTLRSPLQIPTHIAPHRNVNTSRAPRRRTVLPSRVQSKYLTPSLLKFPGPSYFPPPPERPCTQVQSPSSPHPREWRRRGTNDHHHPRGDVDVT